MGGQNIVSTLCSLRRHAGSALQQQLLAQASAEVLALEQPDGLLAKLSEVCDRTKSP